MENNLIDDNDLAKQTGWLRGDIFRNRSQYNSKKIITEIDSNEIDVPWHLAIELFKVHLVSKLYAAGWSFIEAFSLIEEATNNYNKEIDELLLDFIKEFSNIEIYKGEFRPPLQKQIRNIIYPEIKY